MTALFTRLLRNQDGQDFAEYGIALAIVGTAAGVAAVAMNVNVGQIWNNASSLIASAL